MFLDKSVYTACETSIYVPDGCEDIAPDTCYFNKAQLDLIIYTYNPVFKVNPNILGIDVLNCLEFVLTWGEGEDEEQFDWLEAGWRYQHMTIRSGGSVYLCFGLKHASAIMEVRLC